MPVLPPWITPVNDETNGPPMYPQWEGPPAPPQVQEVAPPNAEQTLSPFPVETPPPPGIVDVGPGSVLPPWEQQASRRDAPVDQLQTAPQESLPQAQAVRPPWDPARDVGPPVPEPYSRNGPEMDPEAQAIAQKYAIHGRAEEMAATEAQKAADAYKATIEANAQTQAREQAMAADAEAKVGEAWDAVSKAKVDPEHWMHSRSTGQKIATFIGAAIGGFLGVRNGTGRNIFMEGIRDAVHDDIASQEMNMANMRAAASGKQSLYGQMLQRFGNADVARNMTAATLFNAAGQQLQAKLAGYKSTETQQDGQLALVELQKSRDASLASAAKAQFDQSLQLDEQARKDAESRATIGKTYAETRKLNAETAGIGKPDEEKESLKLVPNLMVPQLDERGRPITQVEEVQGPDGSPVRPTAVVEGRGSSKPQIDPATGKPVYSEVAADKTGATFVKSVQVGKDADGKPVYEDRLFKRTPVMKAHKARNEKEATEVAEITAGYREYEDAMQTLQDLGKPESEGGYGKEWFKSSTGSMLYGQARQNAIFAIQKIHGVKRMTDTDLKLFDRTLPDPGKVVQIGDTGKAIDFARDYGRKAVRTRLSKYGIPLNAVIGEETVPNTPPPIDLTRPEGWSYPPDKTPGAERADEVLRQRQDDWEE